MPTPFAYNSGSTISGTTQYGNIAVGTTARDYSTNPGGLQWWMGPSEDSVYLLAMPDTGMTHTSGIGINSQLQFEKSEELTDDSFKDLVNRVSGESFTGATQAKNWAYAIGFPTSFHSYEPEVSTYISGLTTTLNPYHVGVIDRFVLDIKTGININTLSEMSDIMYILAGETQESSLRNLIKRQHDITAFNSPTFVQYEGFYGNGTSSYLDTNFSGKTQGVTYTLDNASIGMYSRININTAAGTSDLRNFVTPNDVLIAPRYSNKFYGRLHNSSTGNLSFDNTDSRGMYIVTRSGSTINDIVAYKNKTIPSLTKSLLGSTAIPSGTLFIGALNRTSGFSTQQYSFVFAGGYITTTMRDVIVDAFERYLDAHGTKLII